MEIRVYVGLYIFGVSPSGRAVLRALAVFLRVFPFDIDYQADNHRTDNADKQIQRVNARQGVFKGYMTQVESGKLQLKPKITKPIELIEYAIKANRVQAEKFGIQIEVEYPEDKIGKLFVDSEKIAWVLTNLLSNAIRYSSENSRVIIGARQVNENKEIEMYVRDFGKGIDPRYHNSIFEHYFRVPGTKVQGSGLGLSISRDFVEAHGGTLTVESEIGKGSCFTLRLKA